MKKFTLILASLFLALGISKAQQVTVTDLNELDNNKVYILQSARCFLLYSENVSGTIATSNGTKVGTVAFDYKNTNQHFKIEKDGDNYYLFSVGAEKYVTSNGTYSETPNGALTISSSGSADYPWKLCIGGNGMNSQIPGQMDAGIVVNSWTTTDAGNSYKIIDAEASKICPNEFLEFDQNKCYTVTTKQRGGWAVNESGEFVSTKQAGEVAEDNKKFAVLSADGTNYYLYSVGAKGFVKKQVDTTKGIVVKEKGDALGITDASTEGFERIFVRFKDLADGYINLNGESNMDICSWSSIDHGNAVLFIEAGDFDPAEALAMLNNVVEVTYNYTYNDVVVASEVIEVTPGSEYPNYTLVAPYGVVAEEKPAGIVNENVTVEVELSITKQLPFEAAASGEPTKWYYVQIHGNNPSYLFSQGVGNEMVWKVGGNLVTSFTSEDADNYTWGFVGDLFNGYKIVNKAGGAIKSTGSGNVTITDINDATSFIAMPVSQSNNGKAEVGFGMLNKEKGQYINAQNMGINHWHANDAGSTMCVTEIKDTEVTVSALGYATLYLDYSAFIPEGVEAYYVSSVLDGSAKMTLVEGVLPANTGVILKNAGEYTFTTSYAANAIGTNLLTGTTTDTEVIKEDGNSYYILANQGGVGFYSAVYGEDATKFMNRANKAYLVVPNEQAQGAPSFSFNFDFDGTTGIENVATEVNATVYDLQGRRVENPARGIYIVNGKKVLVK